MATNPTFVSVQHIYNDLIGEDGTANADAQGKRLINRAVKDIANAMNFSWLLRTATLSLSGGTANLAADFNPKWGLPDARIVSSSTDDDEIFSMIPIEDRDLYGSDSYVFWITFDSANNVYVFNTPVQSGTVTYYYYSSPADMSDDADVCAVPDAEATAYQAASKYWISNERNVELKREYAQEAEGRVKALYSADLMFGPHLSVGSVIDYNPGLNVEGN